MISRFQRFICDITGIDLYWHRLASASMAAFGLKGSYAIYFVRLFGVQEGMTATELTAACGKDKADVSRDIAELVKLGYMVRETGEKRAYRARIRLTEEGRTLARKVGEKAKIAVGCIGREIPEEDREVFYRVLDQITANLQEMSENGIPDRIV